MKVLILQGYALDPLAGGVQRYTYLLSHALLKKGYEVIVFTLEKNNSYAHLDIQVLDANGSCESVKEFSKVIDKVRPNIIINQMAYESDYSCLLIKYPEILKIAVLHNSLLSVLSNIEQYQKQVVSKIFLPLESSGFVRELLKKYHIIRHRKALKNIFYCHDHFVMYAEPNKKELECFLPDYDARKVALIPLFLPERAVEIPLKKNKIIWVGRLEISQKRADRILNVWKNISSELQDWTLDVIGDGSMLDILREQVRSEKIPRVTFHGKQDPKNFYSEAKIYFMTSDFEGFMYTIIEAQSYGVVPVVFDSFSVVRSILHDGKNGFIVPKGDVEKLSDKIIYLAKDSNKQYEMANESITNVSRYLEDVVIKKWINLFDLSVKCNIEKR